MGIQRIRLPVDRPLLQDLEQLWGELSDKPARFLDNIYRGRVIFNPEFHLYVSEAAHIQGGVAVVGMASLVYSYTLSGVRAEIHDVAVLRDKRGLGIGSELMTTLLSDAEETARQMALPVTLTLTSRPKRKEANAMYRKYGFRRIAQAVGKNGTNLYQKIIEP